MIAMALVGILMAQAHAPSALNRHPQESAPVYTAESCLTGLKNVGIVINISNTSSTPTAEIDQDAIRAGITKRLKEVGVHMASNQEWQAWNDAHPDTPMAYMDVEIMLSPGDTPDIIHESAVVNLTDYVTPQVDSTNPFELDVWGRYEESYIPPHGTERVQQDVDLGMIWFKFDYMRYNPDAKPLDSN
jgi:hypothetical protein